MSRSRKKSPVYAWCNNKSSEKEWKQIGNRKLRRKAKILTNKELDYLVPRKLCYVLDTWSMNKDGTKHWVRPDEKWVIKKYPELFRK